MQFCTSRFSATLLAGAAFASTAFAQSTIYVDENLSTGLNDGSSWADAIQTDDGVRLALAQSVNGDQIFVKEGTYYPTTATGRTLAFNLKTGVELYGGFVGTESSPSERPPLGDAETILSADLNENDGGGIITDNSYHVVNGLNSNATAVLDGFTVTGGNSNGGTNNDRGGGIICLGNTSPTIRNCHFLSNRCTFGGGAGYINGSPTFTDVIFEDNFGGAFGGAFDINGGTGIRFDRCTFIDNQASRAGALEIFNTNGAVVTNSVFRGNRATGTSGGGAVWVGSGGSTTFRNNTVVGNFANTHVAGGLVDSGSNVTVQNCVFWDNQGNSGQNGNNQVSGTQVSYSLIEGGLPGTGNISTAPDFVDQAGFDFRPAVTSPAIDAGSNSLAQAGIVLDYDQTSRIVDAPTVPDTGVGFGGPIDMGAFEYSVGAPDTNCNASPNTSLAFATLTATGSNEVVDNDLNLLSVGVPANEFGFYIMSRSTTNLPVAAGWLCLGGPQYRFANDIINSGPGGTLPFTPDLTNLPQGQVILPGETMYFQAWFRDGATANFTSNLCVEFE
jgi:hypothetical protein